MKYEFTTIRQADVVILHCLPYELNAVLTRCPFSQHAYIIAYCVWEASDLPELFQRSMPRVNEVWTCSEYCRRVFAAHHPSVVLLPHVVSRDRTITEADIAKVKELLSYKDDFIYFLTITSLSDKRKNCRSLISVFHDLSDSMPYARLVVKSSVVSDPLSLPADDRITYITQTFSEGEINALYHLASVYVSIHHSEGWGFPLSDAMLFRIPVIATRYSGNLQFMNDRNSFLVKNTEDYIRPEDQFFLFDGRMKWAYPHLDDFRARLLELYSSAHSSKTLSRTECALRDIKQFDEVTAAGIMFDRLEKARSV